ncbi:type II secretion system F family protein [Roseivivax sediminis]|uniref:Type II secretion system protein F (GspF) n=1 Tax=Roseivivax sediminis TaxID=936889 RepID=A0A1I1UJ08_9RHOB|nr:type II secretion system F family protein [Roseivivax sediminis]SFD68733.1 type II secretion system protein F (GspF) [Roseivivax sediminis]
MRAYAYTAYTAEGRRRSGTVVAESEARAAQDLAAQGLFVSSIDMRGEAATRRRRRARLSGELQAVFTRQMAVLLGADLPAEAALEAVRTSGTGTAMDAMAARARASVMEGAALSDALAATGAGWPRYYIAALRAGERSGDTAAVMGELADHLETAGTERAEIASALVYPGFVAAVALLVCGILMTSVAPQIVEMFALSGRPLPEITQYVLAVSGWIQSHPVPLAILGAVLAALWALSANVPALRAGRDRAALRLPLVGRLMRLSAAVQYLRTLALVLGSRQAVIAAAESAGEVLSVARFRTEAQAATEAVRRGESLAQAMGRLSFVPPVARQLVEAGEMSARVARMAARAAVLVENGLRAERKRIAALIEPLLMIIVGTAVLVIVLAVLLPIFDLQAAVAN